MNGNVFGTAVNIVFVLVFCVIAFGVLLRLLSGWFAPLKKVRAEVTNKQRFDERVQSKSQAPYSRTKYVVTFLVDEKPMAFYVAEDTYNRCRIKQQGILIYKGRKLVDFS